MLCLFCLLLTIFIVSFVYSDFACIFVDIVYFNVNRAKSTFIIPQSKKFRQKKKKKVKADKIKRMSTNDATEI